MDLQERIRQIVAEHSGGIKLVELATLLAAESCKVSERMFDYGDIMLCVEADPTLNGYGYVWHMGDAGPEMEVVREKVFVHQV